MKSNALLFLRISLGLFLVVWGADKLLDVEHGVAVADAFYGGLFSVPALISAFGAVQIVLGLLIVAGWLRRVAYPALLVITGATLLAVWRSILDPLGLVLEGASLLFFPSLIIFAAALVLWAFTDDDTLAVDRGRQAAAPAAEPRRARPAARP